MTGTLTIKERVEREAQYKRLLEQGLNQSEIAARLQVSPQAVSKFLALRGWAVKPKEDR